MSEGNGKAGGEMSPLGVAYVRTAWHEAGHVVQAFSEGIRVIRATVDDGEGRGRVRLGTSPEETDDPEELRKLLRVMVAGQAAAEMVPHGVKATRPKRSDADIYFSPEELDWAENSPTMLAAVTDIDPAELGMLLPSDDELALELAERIAELDETSAWDEFQVAKELAERRLLVENDKLDRIAHGLLMYRDLDGEDIFDNVYSDRAKENEE